MKYNYLRIDDSVVKSIDENYDIYLDLWESKSKLMFVKTIKDYTGLGLKEAKNNTDVIFDGGIELFKNSFGLKKRRREKLIALKTTLLTTELVKMIVDAPPEKLEDVFSDLGINIVEDILNKLLIYEK